MVGNFGRHTLKAKACIPPELRIREFFQHHTRACPAAGVMGGSPVLGAVLGAPVNLVARQRLQAPPSVAKIFEADLVKLLALDIDPIANDPLTRS